VGEADDGLGGADRADAVAAGQAGGEVVGDGLQLGAVVLELLPGLDLGLADGVLAAGVGGDLAGAIGVHLRAHEHHHVIATVG
jgi:hypothetical protein